MPRIRFTCGPYESTYEIRSGTFWVHSYKKLLKRTLESHRKRDLLIKDSPREGLKKRRNRLLSILMEWVVAVSNINQLTMLVLANSVTDMTQHSTTNPWIFTTGKNAHI